MLTRPKVQACSTLLSLVMGETELCAVIGTLSAWDPDPSRVGDTWQLSDKHMSEVYSVYEPCQKGKTKWAEKESGCCAGEGAGL